MRVGKLGRKAATSVNTSVSRRSSSVLQPAERDLGAGAWTLRPFHGEELVRVSYRVDLEEKCVEERKGDGDDAEAERDGRDDRQRHERRPAKRAQREAEVAPERLEEGDPAFVAALVGGERNRPEPRQRLAPGFSRVHTLCDVLPGFGLDMERELVVELPFDRARCDEGAQA